MKELTPQRLESKRQYWAKILILCGSLVQTVIATSLLIGMYVAEQTGDPILGG